MSGSSAAFFAMLSCDEPIRGVDFMYTTTHPILAKLSSNFLVAAVISKLDLAA